MAPTQCDRSGPKESPLSLGFSDPRPEQSSRWAAVGRGSRCRPSDLSCSWTLPGEGVQYLNFNLLLNVYEGAGLQSNPASPRLRSRHQSVSASLCRDVTAGRPGATQGHAWARCVGAKSEGLLTISDGPEQRCWPCQGRWGQSAPCPPAPRAPRAAGGVQPARPEPASPPVRGTAAGGREEAGSRGVIPPHLTRPFVGSSLVAAPEPSGQSWGGRTGTLRPQSGHACRPALCVPGTAS